MSTRTEYYQLHQWVPEDSFLRTDFNEDNTILDEAIHQAQAQADRAVKSLIPVSYNVYQLMLQSYYENKYTGYKKALLFDGFLDTAGIASRSDALCHQSGELCLTSSGQGDLASGLSSSYAANYLSRAFTASGNGRLTGVEFRFQSNYDTAYDGFPIDIVVSHGNTDNVISYTDYRQPNVGAYAMVDVSFTLDTPVDLLDGESYIVTIRRHSGVPSINLNLYTGLSDEYLGGTIHITPEAGTEAAMTSVAHTIPACGTLAAWVRHSGGSVALSLTDSAGTVHSLTADDTEDAVNLQTGDTCKETAFSLTNDIPEGNAALTLTLTRGDDSKMEVFDYGLILI
ncbi:MAG: hypothetical protein LKK00_09105 [Intestinimonas sp.]|jgi:hypothetical protein|nr:hypothetical protein [Intestinimonas sp.]